MSTTNTKNLNETIENCLLATHISNNPNFEAACLSGDGNKIISIVETEMEKQQLYTKGAKKLRDDILKLLNGREKVTSRIGQNILMFVWNSKLSGIGLAVVH